MARRGVVVDVWAVPADVAVPPARADVLDPVERTRAAALPPGAASRFVLGRLLLRGAVAARLGCAPHEVALSARCPRCGEPHGRVHVDGPWPAGVPGTRGLHVGVTRSGPVVAVAVCESGPVGVDAETLAAVAAAPLADVVLSPGERDRRRGGARTGSLARTWVRKEAALKALGTGLTVDPSSVVLGRPRRARGVDAVVGDSVAVADLRLGRGRVGAVAVVVPDLVRPGAARGSGPGRSVPAGAVPAIRLVVRRYDGATVLDTRRG